MPANGDILQGAVGTRTQTNASAEQTGGKARARNLTKAEGSNISGSGFNSEIGGTEMTNAKEQAGQTPKDMKERMAQIERNYGIFRKAYLSF